MLRYASCQRFEFGERHQAKNGKGEDVTVVDNALVAICCDWKVEGPTNFLLDSKQHFEPQRDDAHAAPFYDLFTAKPLTVESVDVQPTGGLMLRLTQGYKLTFIPTRSDSCEDDQWIFLPPETSGPGLTFDGDALSS